MILNFTSFFIGILLLFLLPIILNNSNLGGKLNTYFFVLIAIAGVQRFLFGLIQFKILDSLTFPYHSVLSLSFLLPPIYLIFTENLLFKKTTNKKEISFFGVALLIVLLINFIKLKNHYNNIIFFLYSTTYLVLLIRMNYMFFKNKKNTKENTQFIHIKNWALTIFILFFTIYLFSNFAIFSLPNKTDQIILKKFYDLTSFVWLFVITFLLMNPINLYGEKVLYKKIKKTILNEIVIWKTSKNNNTEIIDLLVEKKINLNTRMILFEINEFETNLYLDFKEVPTLKELSALLGNPQSHIKYIFKYYCNYSFSEYQNVLKIKYSVRLIQGGFLKSNTIDSLSEKCLFNSRITFFNNFKKLIGYSPSDFNITIIDKY
jgi:AraC-like DNA-binding protein